MRNAASQAADGFHFLRLAQLSFEQQTFAHILRNDEANAAAGVFEFVGDDIHFEAFAVFPFVLPVALVAAIPFPLFDVSGERRRIAVGPNFADRHAAKFVFGEAIGSGSGFVDLKKL